MKQQYKIETTGGQKPNIFTMSFRISRFNYESLYPVNTQSAITLNTIALLTFFNCKDQSINIFTFSLKINKEQVFRGDLIMFFITISSDEAN